MFSQTAYLCFLVVAKYGPLRHLLLCPIACDAFCITYTPAYVALSAVLALCTRLAYSPLRHLLRTRLAYIAHYAANRYVCRCVRRRVCHCVCCRALSPCLWPCPLDSPAHFVSSASRALLLGSLLRSVSSMNAGRPFCGCSSDVQSEI